MMKFHFEVFPKIARNVDDVKEIVQYASLLLNFHMSFSSFLSHKPAKSLSPSLHRRYPTTNSNTYLHTAVPYKIREVLSFRLKLRLFFMLVLHSYIYFNIFRLYAGCPNGNSNLEIHHKKFKPASMTNLHWVHK